MNLEENIKRILKEETEMIGSDDSSSTEPQRVCDTCKWSKPISYFRGNRKKCKKCENKIRYNQKLDRRSNDPEYDNMLKQDDVMRKRSKEKNDPMASFKQSARSNDRGAFRRMGYSKNSKSYDILGIDWEGYKKHIEDQFVDGMSWDNIGLWEIDHIIPLSLANNVDEIKELSHYTNRQPLWGKDNKLKSDKVYLEKLTDDIRNKYQKFIDRYLERKLSPEYTNGNVINYINKEMDENDPNDYNDEFGYAINIISWTLEHFFPEYDLEDSVYDAVYEEMMDLMKVKYGNMIFRYYNDNVDPDE
jgi:hypothetical protein